MKVCYICNDLIEGSRKRIIFFEKCKECEEALEREKELRLKHGLMPRDLIPFFRMEARAIESLGRPFTMKEQCSLREGISSKDWKPGKRPYIVDEEKIKNEAEGLCKVVSELLGRYELTEEDKKKAESFRGLFADRDFMRDRI
jgi:hypothetical protein